MGDSNYTNGNVLKCHYDKVSCSVEDGNKVHEKDQILLICEPKEPLEEHIDEKKALQLNGDFSMTKDGYLSTLNGNTIYFIRSIPNTVDVRVLMKEIDKSQNIFTNLIDEVLCDVVY
ncbi:hypothetical protein EJ063_07635 [Vibrio aquaticus]|uniref:Uncharacterized protein n=1 Tax=Vibrio aquaticus TaxID=2496559 RepID=A0A432CYV4_9VIBR|nr:hypothetical protein [Vibrio aquaticus]RTZ16656.1 hypothetical protein EJ063_07635 [Vibrio aquaticus]